MSRHHGIGWENYKRSQWDANSNWILAVSRSPSLFQSACLSTVCSGAMTNLCVSAEWLKVRSAVQTRIKEMVKVASSDEPKTLLRFQRPIRFSYKLLYLQVFYDCLRIPKGCINFKDLKIFLAIWFILIAHVFIQFPYYLLKKKTLKLCFIARNLSSKVFRDKQTVQFSKFVHL